MLEQERDAIVSVRDRSPSATRPTWIVPVVRGAFALVATVVITFSADHSAAFGMIAFGAWALATGLMVGALESRLETVRSTRLLVVIMSVVTAIAGVLALTLPASIGMFLVLVSAWAAITGFIELFVGIRMRGRHPAARDRITAGVLTAVLALAFLLLPPNDVVSVGLLGAYFVLLGVFLVIGGVGAKPTRAARAGASADAS